MTAPPSLLEVPTVITTHHNADFDALAAAVGAALLYPEARIVFAGSLNPNVREFVSLHGENLPIVSLRLIDQSKIRRLVVVDTADPGRIGDLGRLCGREDVETVVFDHHQAENPQRPSFVRGEDWVLSADGAQATSMLYILRERGVEVPRLEATIFALGIHEDTGSLTYPRTTIRDAEMLAASMRLGASQALIERYLHSALTKEQREVLMRMIDAVRVERVKGLDVHVVALEVTAYVDGLSVLAHKLMELINAEVLLQAVGMEERVFVTARSRAGSVDVGALLHAVDGGGHAQAASAVTRGKTPREVVDELLEALAQTNLGAPTAGEIMSRPVRFIDADTPVTEALVTAQRYGHSGICVREEGRVVGVVARRDLDKAIRHGLGHAPVKGVMTRNITFARWSTGVDELRRIMVEGNIGRVPVVADEAYDEAVADGSAPVADVIGIATRTDVLAAYHGRWEQEQADTVGPQVYALQALPDHPFFGRLFQACSALSEDFAGVYLVGGFVRDLLLEQPNVDVDVAVEGDGIEFATRLAAQLGGRVRAHRKFKTAVVLLPPSILGEAPAWLRSTGEPFHVDVATTRTEFYDYPAALPRVEHASIRQDLFRRDFTINAMAVSLRGRDFGTVIDFFGGYRDLRDGVIRVLHNLSFIEDPTRIFRAVRYENRYGFRMDEQTRSFAKSCVDMHLVGDLSSVRLRDELTALLGEEDVEWTLGRLFELGVAREVHPKLATGTKTATLVRRIDSLVAELGVGDEVVSWRLRLAAMTRNMEHDELYLWLEQLKLKRSDSAVIRAGVVMGPVLAASLAREEMSEWEIYRTLRSTPLEALVFALAEAEGGPADARLRRYLTEVRHRTLSIGGDDLLALGVKKGPPVGRLLERLREMRVTETIQGREAELEAARTLLERRR
ncbi:MAG: CBS domain-containing protein [Thermoleophilia bacterium]|nr:CBS domain-containing protein [Thermoleophilia bacterium]